MMNNRRYYSIADITIQVDSDLPITDTTFSNQLELFRVDSPGGDTVTIHHHFKLPDLKKQTLGKEVYRKMPWAIFQQEEDWVYFGILPQAGADALSLWKVVTFNHDHTHAEIYNNGTENWLKDDLHSQDPEYLNTCLQCAIINLCMHCAARAYLETGAMDGVTPYFCEVAHARAAAIQENSV